MASSPLKAAYLRSKAVEYAWSFLGLPYRWGGDDPIAGFDCSGLVIEVLQSVGVLRHGLDYSANDLYQIFRSNEVSAGYAGCIVFWFQGIKAIHVELMVDDYHTLGASGGGSSTDSIDDAISQNAFVKMRPIGYRGSGFKIVDPFKGVV